MYTENENALWGQQRTLSSGVTIAIGSPDNAGAQGPKTVKEAQSDPNYVSRLLLDCVPVFHKISLTVSMAYTVH